MPAEPLAKRSELYFQSGDARCHAWLYMPDGASSEARPPIIVMAHGLGAVKAVRLSAFAERFQAKGYACLVFDYRHFGESEGEPRELLSLKRQREDWQAELWGWDHEAEARRARKLAEFAAAAHFAALARK